MSKLSFFLQDWGSRDRPLAYYLFVDEAYHSSATWQLNCHKTAIQIIVCFVATLEQTHCKHIANAVSVHVLSLKPTECHCPQGYHSDQSTATQTKIWVNYTIGLPLCQFIATLPLECHSDIFQCHSGSLDTWNPASIVEQLAVSMYFVAT